MQSCGMRIWHQSMNEIDGYPVYRDALQSHVDRVAGPGVEVVLHGVAPGTYGSAAPAQVLVHPTLFHRIASQLLDRVEQAEAEGFDAVAIGSFSEPFLRALRSAVDIPVASMAESALLTSCTVGRLSGLVTISDDVAWMVRQIVRDNELGARVAGVWTVHPDVTEADLAAAFDAPDAVLASFTASAREALAAGADVIVPAEGVINELLVAQGVVEIDGAPVLDAVGTVVLHAKMLAELRERTGLHAGRRWHHRRPAAVLLEQLATPR